MLQLTRETFGAALNLGITGDAAEVALHVNKLFNYGIISNVPDTFEENKDTHVVVQSDPGRFGRGLKAMAIAQLSEDAEAVQEYKGVPFGFNCLSDLMVARFMQDYKEQPTHYEISVGEFFTLAKGFGA